MIARVDVRLERWGAWVRTGAGIRLSYPSIATELRGIYGPSGAAGAEGEDLLSEEMDRLIAKLEENRRNLTCDWYVARMDTHSLIRLYHTSYRRLYETMDRVHHFLDGAISTKIQAACVRTESRIEY